MVDVQCKHCHKGFYAKPSWIAKGQGLYCSLVCARASAKSGKVIKCHQCGSEAYKQLRALNRSKSGFFFCSKSCQTKWRNKVYVREKHPNWKNGAASYRNLMLNNIPPICTLCNTTDTRILAVHHIDEDRSHNVVENLAWLCHNCHHLVHHYHDERERFMAAMV